MKSLGVLYVATGQKYLEEAVQSARSLKRHAPGIPCALVTDQPPTVTTEWFDEVILEPLNLPEGKDQWKHHLLYKIKGYALSPYEKTLFLDSDTYVAAPIDELFHMLTYMDLLVTKDMHDYHEIALEGRVVEGFTPYNTGVVAYRRSPATQAFLTDWYDLYARHWEDYWSDQPAFMHALTRHTLRSYCLHSAYNFRFLTNVGFMARSEVKIIHGRVDDDTFRKIAARVNATTAQRAWVASHFRAYSWHDRPLWARIKNALRRMMRK